MCKGEDVFVHKRITSAFKTVEYVTDRMPHILRGCWCGIIILNMHALTEDKADDTVAHLSITFSNQRFSNCSPSLDVVFVKLISRRTVFVETRFSR
jgi:hypothetical protein